MEIKHIQATLQFMERVSLNRAEVDAYDECVKQLHLLAKEQLENNERTEKCQ